MYREKLRWVKTIAFVLKENQTKMCVGSRKQKGSDTIPTWNAGRRPKRMHDADPVEELKPVSCWPTKTSVWRIRHRYPFVMGKFLKISEFVLYLQHMPTGPFPFESYLHTVSLTPVKEVSFLLCAVCVPGRRHRQLQERRWRDVVVEGY